MNTSNGKCINAHVWTHAGEIQDGYPCECGEVLFKNNDFGQIVNDKNENKMKAKTNVTVHECGNKSKPLLSSRLFKFRAWITNLGFPFMAIQGTPYLETLSSFMLHYSDSKNIMQFTGFYDKNGKEIYIGDILINEGFMIEISTGDKKSKYKEFYEVVDNGAFYTTRKIKNNYTSQIPNSQEIYSEFYEVIGNIFENPELL